MKHQDWYEPMRAIKSKGSQTKVVGGLGGLAKARAEHEGQFFTPDDVVEFMWRLACLDHLDPTYRINILDNSCGTGRMFQFADPKKHRIYGYDVDPNCVNPLRDALKAGGFEYQIELGSMETMRCGTERIDVALINPPFSIPIDTPMVEKFPFNAYGRYGERSSTVSHKYAVAQALKWCYWVIALVPTTFARECREDPYFKPRLYHTYDLPKNTFQSEGADVATSIITFVPNQHNEKRSSFKVNDLREAYRLPEVKAGDKWTAANPTLRTVKEEQDKPAIKLPYTGSKKVRICHNGRRVILKFECGATQGRVMNRLMQDLVEHNHRRSKEEARGAIGIEYVGQGKLDLENYLAQPKPLDAWEQFVSSVALGGYDVEVDEGITNYLRHRARFIPILNEPFRHTVFLADGGLANFLTEFKGKKIRAKCKKEFDWTAKWSGVTTMVPVGQIIELTYDGIKDYCYKANQSDIDLSWSGTYKQCSSGVRSIEFLLEHFTFPDFKPAKNDWTTMHAGLRAHFPDRYRETELIARRIGLDKWCSWDFQLDDLIELGMKQGNSIAAWEMGLGKARLASALCMLGQGEKNLITVEAHLVDEMQREFATLGIPADQWQLIEKPEDLVELKRINLISYSRLKMPVHKDHPKVTYAKRLRRRIHTMVCDEFHLLRNLDTDQSQAVLAVSPKRRYGMTGTPIANYPRDVLPLMQWTAGDGTANQPFGLNHPYMEARNLSDMGKAVRGIDVFKNMFVTTEWVTNEFSDDLRSGAKREIPKIKDIRSFRAMLAPIVKRRTLLEPEVAKFIQIPKSEQKFTDLDWDMDHLLYYYQVAEAFVEWFKNLGKWEKEKIGLIAILAKMQAVYMAANFPQAGVMDLDPYEGVTSKQRYALKRIKEMVKDGHKIIFFAHSPQICDWMSRQIGSSIPHTVFHGGIPIAKRIKAMDKEFRFGPKPLLLATKGTLQTGYNIWQADRALIYDRAWAPKIEHQAVARLLRPQQKKVVEIEFLHLHGSIDTYQDQMCSFKAEAMKAGLDYGDEDPSREFVHIETILGKFVEDFETKIGQQFRDMIANKNTPRRKKSA